MCKTTLTTFMTLALGEEAAAGDVRVAAAIPLGAAVLLGELEAEVLADAARAGRVLAGVATSDSKAA